MTDWQINPDEFERATCSIDLWLRLAGVIDAEQFERILDGMLNSMVVFEFEFEQRFPAEAHKWQHKYD